MQEPNTIAEFCMFAAQHWSLCMTRSEWAAWFQAIGSVTAVASEVAVVWWQLGDKKRERKADEIRQLLVFAESAYHAHFTLDWFEGFAAMTNRAPTVNIKGARPHLEALIAVPALQVADEETAVALLELGRSVTGLYSVADQCVWPTGGSIELNESGPIGTVDIMVGVVKRDLEHLIASVCNAVAARGGSPPPYLLIKDQQSIRERVVTHMQAAE